MSDEEIKFMKSLSGAIDDAINDNINSIKILKFLNLMCVSFIQAIEMEKKNVSQ
jgi:hypothetical protein